MGTRTAEPWSYFQIRMIQHRTHWLWFRLFCVEEIFLRKRRVCGWSGPSVASAFSAHSRYNDSAASCLCPWDLYNDARLLMEIRVLAWVISPESISSSPGIPGIMTLLHRTFLESHTTLLGFRLLMELRVCGWSAPRVALCLSRHSSTVVQWDHSRRRNSWLLMVLTTDEDGREM